MLENLEPSQKTVQYAKKAKPLTVHEKLRAELKYLYATEWSDEWLTDLPKKWKLCDDLLILQPSCFSLPHWSQKYVDLWKLVANVFKVRRVAIENRVKSDDFRTPNLTLLYGTDPIVIVNNNGIKYLLTKLMLPFINFYYYSIYFPEFKVLLRHTKMHVQLGEHYRKTPNSSI